MGEKTTPNDSLANSDVAIDMKPDKPTRKPKTAQWKVKLIDGNGNTVVYENGGEIERNCFDEALEWAKRLWNAWGIVVNHGQTDNHIPTTILSLWWDE